MILVVFLAGYLSENRALLADESTRIGPIRLPPLPYLAPMVAMVAIALGDRRRPAGPRRRAAVLRRVPRAAVRRDRPAELRDRRACCCSSSARLILYNLFGHVQTRVDNWLDPLRDPQGAGFQVIQALYAFARGGILGVGLGNGLPTIGGRPADPRDPHRLPARGAGRGAGPRSACSRSWACTSSWCQRGPPDRRRGARRLPVAARRRASRSSSASRRSSSRPATSS